ncbi:MAG TPA: dihydrolipoamide acetyltransferase family protein [Solirubrobacterales bacterium]|nr:dihydrolipoamide acetyltransferase family protein [Solirubrobacterales bacterium]
MADVVMPRLSDSMEEGTILRWLKGVGDAVAVGEELVEIETDKANMAYESDLSGTLTEILAEEGETLPIGAPIARVGDGQGAGGSAAGPLVGDRGAPRAPSPSPPPSPTPVAEEAGKSRSGSEVGGRLRASPVARRVAEGREVDLAQIRGSGPGGRIVKADVEKAVAPGAPASASAQPAGAPGSPETAKGQTVYRELSKLQATVARRMAESKATAPHFYLEAAIEMSRALEARGRIKAAAPDAEMVPSFNDMVVKACALALREYPRANGAYRDGRFELYSRVNVGVAVAGQDALVVPTIFDADRKGLGQIAAESRALAQRVREGLITPPELSGATFTVSNLGMYGIERFSAVINPPQAAILAVGAIGERPVIRDGEIAAAHLMQVTLACDHRILYGADGAQFLARIRSLLEEPLSLAL